jgi:hypothetical protein
MATTDSPRRVLGERDVNKSLLAAPLFTTSPKKPSSAVAIAISATRDKAMEAEQLSKALLSPRMDKVAPMSPSSARKRNASCMEDVRDGSPRKQVAVEILADENVVVEQKNVDTVSRSVQTGDLNVRVQIDTKEETMVSNFQSRREVE